MDTTLASAANPTATAATGDAPRNLLGRPASRHRGTDIDGATLEPEALRVRDLDLNTLIGATTFEGALAHLWFDVAPGSDAHRAHQAALGARLAAFAAALAPGSAAQCVAADLGAAGVAPVFAAASGLLRGFDDVLARVDGHAPDDADLDAMLLCVAAAPFLLHAAIEGRPFAARHDNAATSLDHASTHAQRMLALTGATRDDAPAQAAMNMLLVAWHAGFGYITPTVLAPRVAIGTGVTLTQAIAAGFLASGPSHVGAALEAMHWLGALARSVPGGTTAPHAALDAAGRTAIDAALDAKLTLYGFGHPLFVADPRPPHMRRQFAERGFDGAYLTLFDACCAQADARRALRPNIDFLTAATLLDLGVTAPSWGVGIGLGARIAAMAAHAVERRRRPAFGVNSATARRLLAAVPVGWL
ncbi:citrate synthase family protein [Burkholderia ambifaria AMMD]|uniref:citrate synthase (unknown stereospecificity) n=1 Tax=Burkholderia ambifaria (strain ATCC BAA-244 / DSM 16087 / CCUG 44356 / LMG 19182 / AMMD) TaxID=339670 RepID=Q0B2E4_BURCM|nr:citrate/2-methylcitrate synthase [Burkholderia ambifaria]ABI91679.1 citrate synthase-like protein [Burkholderia ambifaria AMMD]AJY26707.1 citrate synthase family protein [Burkholderia ambifaria AMMD]MBR7933419.1 citrate/2-methylcitrate synthase [Burkholderia ambifaria]PEH70440.1 citrate synthase [Burkholderia ambifaria]QQC08379.1 citrate/2-methylcitrate synthase [Burkholderia ambifaria]